MAMMKAVVHGVETSRVFQGFFDLGDAEKESNCSLIKTKSRKRRINRLDTLFGWNIHSLDATESILCKLDDTWDAEVVGPAVDLIRSFLDQEATLVPKLDALNSTGMNMVQRDLWTQYTCKACGDRVLRGAYEWEQHKQGRGRRKRISRLRKP